MNPMDGYLVTLLAICLWREARGEGLEGMRAVAHVIRNRVNRWKQDWDQVIAGRNQFSSMTVSGDSQLVVWPDDDDPMFKQVYLMSWDIFKGQNPDPTNGSLYYANINLATKPGFSPWFLREIMGKPAEHPVRATIGRHTFYA